MKDRFTLGFIAGIIGAILMNAINLFNYYVLHIIKLRYLDFAGFMIFGKMPKTLSEVILSQIVQLGFSGALGAIFAYFLLLVNSKNHWFKGLLWGTGTWFVIYSFTVLYRIPVISTPDFATTLSQYISTGIYGVTMALTFVWLQQRVETVEPEKVRKYRLVPMPSWKKTKGKKIHVRKPYKIE